MQTINDFKGTEIRIFHKPVSSVIKKNMPLVKSTSKKPGATRAEKTCLSQKKAKQKQAISQK